jgi:hypothetical protein
MGNIDLIRPKDSKTFSLMVRERKRKRKRKRESDRIEIDEKQFDKRELTPLSKRCSLYSLCLSELRLAQEASKAS